MVAFFEGRNDEALEAINALTASADNPVLLNILAFIDYDKSGSNYERLRNEAERVIRSSEKTSKKLLKRRVIFRIIIYLKFQRINFVATFICTAGAQRKTSN